MISLHNTRVQVRSSFSFCRLLTESGALSLSPLSSAVTQAQLLVNRFFASSYFWPLGVRRIDLTKWPPQNRLEAGSFCHFAVYSGPTKTQSQDHSRVLLKTVLLVPTICLLCNHGRGSTGFRSSLSLHLCRDERRRLLF